MNETSSYILDLKEIDRTKIATVGGKGANLGELTTVEGIKVPGGFCISTEAFKRIINEESSVYELLNQLSILNVEDKDKMGKLCDEIRRVIEGISIPADIQQEITSHLSLFGEQNAYAIRSSATAEDLSSASFAGQQDTYLNIIGKDAILHCIRRCWASLFTQRAVIYRLQNGFDHRKVYLSVIVQKMVSSQVAGILFTADPLTSNRKVISIDAGFGLGDAMVSGLVNADHYKVRDGRIIDKKISTKKLAIYPLAEGGTREEEIEPLRQNSQALTDEQIMELAQTGRKIEEHFGCPQDVEWCLADNTIHIVQSRPITTLFPVPEANDHRNHVYISVGHQQMMTDAMRPLGLSLWQLTAFRPLDKAGGRLFVDVTNFLASPESRENLLNVVGESEPLIKDALLTILDRGDFVSATPEEKEVFRMKGSKGMSVLEIEAQAGNDPDVVHELIARGEKLIEHLRRNIQTKSGVDLFSFILEDALEYRKSLLEPRNMGVIMAAMNASSWINEKMNEWLGEKKVADTLSLSVPNNITSEMGLALLDVADVIRPYPQVIQYLQQVKDDNFLDELGKYEGGKETRHVIQGFLDKFGMRCVGEIDITRPRWSEKPSTLVPIILSNIRNLGSGASSQKFEQGRQKALKKERELLDRLKQLPDGEQKASETKQMINVIRNFSGYREYPKYFIINHYFIYKQALLKEAAQLLQAGVISEMEDIYYLTFEELREVIQTKKLDYQLIGKRKHEYELHTRLTPPRVITSDGEIITGRYKREHLPARAIVGLAVSAGITEGRARVISNMEDADLEDGDILVTAYTDPSWTPLFLSIKGLVTEIGGLMTHGAVIAREYGLPAIVGVENATKLIRNGQRIRVNGTDGYVEIINGANLPI